MKSLAGLRVLDLSRVLAGPWATQLLADLGAEIIKVEHPSGGDDTRSWGPPYFEGGGYREAAYFMAANRGKRSLAIDFGSDTGQEIVRALALESDVVVENFKLGGLARYGLDAETLRSANPRLIYCSITGFGHEGPRAAQPGYDFVIQGLAGFMSVTGEPGGRPLKAGVAITDVMTGLYAATAILAAVVERQATGEGRHVQVSLFDVQLATLANQALNYLASGDSPGQLGNAHPNIVPYQSFETADRSITVAVGNNSQFARLCEILGLATLAANPSYATNGARVVNRKTLLRLLGDRFLTASADHWTRELERAGIPGGPINDIAAAFAEPHAVERGVVTLHDHRLLGAVPGVACPIRSAGQAFGAESAPPMLGEHSREVLRELPAMTDERIDALERAGVVTCGAKDA